jgi:hypothetical protein
VASGSPDIFVKFHVEAVRSGLLRELNPRLWATLSVIATHIDKNGECWPTQERIAYLLGVNRTTAGKNVRDLLAFTFEGKPVLTARKVRTNEGSFDNTVYKVLPESGFTIY